MPGLSWTMPGGVRSELHQDLKDVVCLPPSLSPGCSILPPHVSVATMLTYGWTE